MFSNENIKFFLTPLDAADGLSIPCNLGVDKNYFLLNRCLCVDVNICVYVTIIPHKNNTRKYSFFLAFFGIKLFCFYIKINKFSMALQFDVLAFYYVLS